MNWVAEDILMHMGVKRRSGRYPWCSGDSPYQHERDFLSRVEAFRKQGLSEVEIASKMECVNGTRELRRYIRIAEHERTAANVMQAKALRDARKTYQQISDEMGLSGPAAARSRGWQTSNRKQQAADRTVDILREQVEKKGAIDIGEGAELDLGVSRDTLLEAATRLGIEEGYRIEGYRVPQALGSGGHSTTMTALTKDISLAEIYQDPTLVKPINDVYSPDGGVTWKTTQYPTSIDSSRIEIKYGDEGGKEFDGVIQIRPGVPDLTLGNAHYAQSRILVDDNLFMKGMAMYADDLPEGVDVRFNTNKPKGTPLEDVLKPAKLDDPDNPFGVYLPSKGQTEYVGEDGQTHISAVNKLREEGQWNEQRVTLSAQFLGKQPVKLAQQQLDLTYANFADELDEISRIPNNAVREKMLLDFAGKCDTESEELKAAGFPRQRTQVLLPLTKIKDNEIYAPNYDDGETVALVRYPHAGRGEIPILTVNNKNAQGRELLGQALDAVGISSKTAQKLSGADFDGDFVSVIPFGKHVKIESENWDLVDGFDPSEKYPPITNANGDIISRTMSKHNKQVQMGIVSNLITDMQLKDAPPEDLAKAVKHSMVVIDSEKHKLNYHQSAIDNDIEGLKKKYQKHIDLNGNEVESGASTLLSRAKNPVYVDERRFKRIDRETGEQIFEETGRTYNKYVKGPDGKTLKGPDGKPIIKEGPIVAQQQVRQMALVSDAHELSTGTKMETVYGDFANKMKALANTARKTAMATPHEPKYNKSAAETYSQEVSSLNNKLKSIGFNQPRERQAQRLTYVRKKALLEAYPELGDKENKSKLNKRTTKMLYEARAETGAKSSRLSLTDREWDAINAGAITYTRAKTILSKVDPDELKQRSMPKQSKGLTPTQKSRIEHLRASGYTQAQIASSMGISSSTVNKFLQGKMD